MAKCDTDNSKYFPTTFAGHKNFKADGEYQDGSDRDKLMRLVKIEGDGKHQNIIIQCQDTDFVVLFELAESPDCPCDNSGAVLIKQIQLQLQTSGGNKTKPKVVLWMDVHKCAGLEVIPAKKLQACNALIRFQSEGSVNEQVLDFFPGRWLLPHEEEDESSIIWFAVVKLHQLNPLPWAKFDENWSFKGSKGRKGTIEVKWIKEKTPPTLFMTMLEEQKYTDFKISCSDNKDVLCHRSVLAVASDALDRLLMYKDSTGSFDYGDLFGADSKTTTAFLRCIYSEFKDVTDLYSSFKVASTVLKIAVEYNITKLVETSANIIIDADHLEWFDGALVYDLYGFVRLLTDSYEIMGELKKKLLRISKKLLVERRKRRAGEMEEEDGADSMLDFQWECGKKSFKQWLGDVLELDG